MRNIKQMRRYGFDHPQKGLWERHGGTIIKAVITGASILIIGMAMMAFYVLAPVAIEHSQDRAAVVVAESLGK